MKERIRWFFETLSESRTLRIIQMILNIFVFLCLMLSGIIIIQFNVMLGSIILLVMAMFLLLNRKGI